MSQGISMISQVSCCLSFPSQRLK